MQEPKNLEALELLLHRRGPPREKAFPRQAMTFAALSEGQLPFSLKIFRELVTALS